MKARAQRWSAARKLELLLLLARANSRRSAGSTISSIRGRFLDGDLPQRGSPLALTASCRSWLMHEEGIMRGIAIALAVAGLAVVGSGTASAQQRMIMGDMITASGTVEKIDQANRQVTLKGADGLVTVEVPKE